MIYIKVADRNNIGIRSVRSRRAVQKSGKGSFQKETKQKGNKTGQGLFRFGRLFFVKYLTK